MSQLVFQQFHSDGALSMKCIYTPQSIPGTLCAYEVKKEEFFYNYLNLTNKYIFMQGEACSTDMAYFFDYPKTEWRYRFNPFGEREQKRMYQSPLGDTGNEMYPWVYYLLGVDNRQYATYYGMQSSDNSVLMNDYTYVARPDPYKPATFFYLVEYNVYGNEQAPKMTYKYVNGQWQKQYKIYDYLGSLRYTMSGTGQVLNYKSYEPYGETMLDTLGVTRQSYIGKEKDVESSLGDHGVRKNDYETGRFNSVDPLFEKYMGWSPYQYSMNNPIWAKDWNGRDIIVLLDKQGASGAGHMAVLIGNDNDGWKLYSKNGTDENSGFQGKSEYQAGEEKNTFKTLNDFISNTKPLQIKYDVGFQISTTTDEDNKMKTAAEAQVKSDYHLIHNSCADTPSNALKAVGKASGISTKTIRDKERNEYIQSLGNRIPKGRYSDIKKGNTGGQELDLNKMRNQ